MIDYTIFYKKRFEHTLELRDKTYDLFISVYNDSERVKKVYEDIDALSKIWLLLPEYAYTKSEFPTQDYYCPDLEQTEDETIRSFIDSLNLDFTISKVCIDITGFIRPHLVFLVRYLSTLKIGNVDFIYTDPIKYKKKENTIFSDEYIRVRQIAGCEGRHNPETDNDFLVMGSGYDSRRITDVAKNKDKTKKVQIFGFPSLQPDMYQENILKAYSAEEESADGRQVFIDPDFTLFAPANDPFVTASSLQNFVKEQVVKRSITNLYLSPMATKAQTLGFAIFYITECITEPVSMIFPFCRHYSRETTEGISKIWRYTVEFKVLLEVQKSGINCFAEY